MGAVGSPCTECKNARPSAIALPNRVMTPATMRNPVNAPMCLPTPRCQPAPTIRLQCSRLFYHRRGRDRTPIVQNSSGWPLFGMTGARMMRACFWRPPLYLGIYTGGNTSPRTFMRAKRKHWLLCLALAVQLTCASAASAKDIVVFAAASLKNALDEASAAYQREAESKVLIDRKSK